MLARLKCLFKTITAVFLLVFTIHIAYAAENSVYIDTHVHLRGNTLEGSALGPQKSPSRKPRGPFFPRKRGPKMGENRGSESQGLDQAVSGLFYQMDRYKVAQALVVVVPGHNSDPDEEYQKFLSVTRRYPERLKLIAGGARLSPYLQKIDADAVTDADRGRFRAVAESILADGAVGFGEMLSYHLCLGPTHSFQLAPADHPLFLLLADIAAEHDVPIDLHMEAVTRSRPMPENLLQTCSKNPSTLEPTIPALETLLAHDRNARIVWQHIGWDNTGDMAPSLIRHLITQHPNLYLALRVENRDWQVGSAGAMPNRLVDTTGAIDPEWLALINDFPDRFMIGSDEFFFSTTGEARPNQSFEGTWRILDQLAEPVARKVGHENAARVYRLAL